MAHVFVSYAEDDRGVAQVVMQAIERAGLKVFRGLSVAPGAASRDVADLGSETGPCIVVLWSKSVASAGFGPQDIQYAIHAWSSGRFVLITLDDTPLPLGLRDLQGIALRRDQPDFGAIVERVTAIANPSTVLAQPQTSVAAPSTAPGPASARAPARSRGGWIAASAGAIALILIGGGVWMSLRSSAPPPRAEAVALERRPIGEPPAAPPQPVPVPPAPVPMPAPQPEAKPAPPEPIDSGLPAPLIALIAAVAIVGAALGAGAVLVLTRRHRREPKPAAPAATALARIVPVSSSGADPVIFVSYSRQDGQTIEQLVRQIEQMGYAVWIDRQSTGSQRYAAPIVRAIKTSKLVALMCSHNAFESDHVIREVYVAGDCKKPFIAFLLDPTEFPDEVQYFVSGFPRVPVAALDMQQLRAEIARLVVA